MTTPAQPDGNATPPLGRFHLVDGRRLALYRSGSGGPPVVFLPGAGSFGLDLLNVHELAAAVTTSVLYDRGGTGWSDPVPLPRTPGAVTDELRLLLQAAGITPPFLLVGHSLGGAYARHFAQRFPTDVAGLLLLDPAHEDLTAHMPVEVQQAQEAMKGQTWDEAPPGMLEMYTALFTQKLAGWPATLRDRLIAQHLEHWRTGLFEASNAEDVLYPALREAGATPDVPLVVLNSMAIDPAQAAFMPASVLEAVNVGKRAVNAQLAASVPRGELRDLPDASHAWLHIDRPDAVLQGIVDLLARVRG